MAAPLSQDLRRQLVRAVDEDSSARAATARFQVSVSAAIKLVRRVRETGSRARFCCVLMEHPRQGTNLGMARRRRMASVRPD